MENSKLKEVFESIVYIFLIILVIFASVYGPINVRLIPLLFVLGVAGSAIFKRQILTTVLGFVVALCINYLKMPSDIAYVFFTSSTMCLNIVIGELFGRYIIKLIDIKNNKDELDDKVKRKKNVVCVCILGVTIILSLLIHNFTNGSIVTYQNCKKSLDKYLRENYSNVEKFREVNVNYYVYKNPRYVFYLSNTKINGVYKFTVYVNEDYVVIDEYKNSVQSDKISKISNVLTNHIISLEDSSKYDDLNIKVKFSNDEKVCLSLSKSVENIDEKISEDFAKEVASYLEDIKSSSVYDNIEQIDMYLKSTKDDELSLASIIYLDAYDLAISEKSDISYKYILRALKMEYDY